MQPSVSIIIPNYNYCQYLGFAIDSALCLDWADTEIIVVDDGSSDGSGAVIDAYGDRIQAVFQENAGQLVACMNGFERSKGDLIIFLDSDDVLDPSVVREAAAVWRPATSKVQFQMRTIDRDGYDLGSFLPQYRVIPTSGQIRRWALTTGTYPTAPGSGNIYARQAVQKIFQAIPGHDIFQERVADAPLLAAAPFLGDVLVVAKPLVAYRIHGRNHGVVTTLDEKRFTAEVQRALRNMSFVRAIALSAGLALPETAIYRSLWFIPYRLASLLLRPAQHPIAGDSAFAIVSDTCRAALMPQGFSPGAVLVLVVWVCVVAILPKGPARALILWRFASGSRPEFLRQILRSIRVVQ